MNRKIIGITGGLCTGKTTVTDMFAAKGAAKIDADEIAHKLLEEDDQIIQKVIELFGENVLTHGKIDRRKLAGEVFFDKKKLDDLCGVLHPVIIQQIKDEAERLSSPVIVIDAPLLIEAGLRSYVDIVIVVTCDIETQTERARDRGISDEEARRIIDKQMPLVEKIKSADYIIDNNANLNVAKEGVDKIWQRI